jgi:MFS family permease
MSEGLVRAPVSPTERLGRLMASFFGVQLFVNVANGGAANSLLPNLIAQVDAGGKVAVLGAVGAVAAVVALVTQPVWGLLSDRTSSRWGRRVPWVTAGIAGLGLTFLWLATVTTVPLIVVGGALVSLFYSMITGPLAAVVPERTPVSRRGVFSGLGSLGIFVGALAGVALAAGFVTSLATGFVVFAAVAILGVPFAFALREHPQPAARERVPWRQVLRGFVVDPRRHPDFCWAFLARLVLMVGYWSVVSFQLYILDDYIGLGLERANQLFPVTTAVLALGIVVALVPAGLLSDRTGRRKPFVVVSSLVVAVSAIVPVVWPTPAGAIAAVAVGGLGFGIYLAVDQALMTQVLPDTANAGKDLGVLNIAQAGGQVVAPLVASLVIGVAGYPALYGFAAVMAVLAAVAVLPIRSVP